MSDDAVRRHPGEWSRALRAITDWRYVAAIALLLLIASVVLAQYLHLRGLSEVTDEIAARTKATECLAEFDGAYDRAVADLLYLLVAPGEDPEELQAAADRAVAATRLSAVQVCLGDLD